MADEPGAWSRPDMGVDPEDYVSDEDGEGRPPSNGNDAIGGEPAGSAGEDDLSPGRSVVDDSDDDAVEPNEPG